MIRYPIVIRLLPDPHARRLATPATATALPTRPASEQTLERTPCLYLPHEQALRLPGTVQETTVADRKRCPGACPGDGIPRRRGGLECGRVRSGKGQDELGTAGPGHRGLRSRRLPALVFPAAGRSVAGARVPGSAAPALRGRRRPTAVSACCRSDPQRRKRLVMPSWCHCGWRRSLVSLRGTRSGRAVWRTPAGPAARTRGPRPICCCVCTASLQSEFRLALQRLRPLVQQAQPVPGSAAGRLALARYRSRPQAIPARRDERPRSRDGPAHPRAAKALLPGPKAGRQALELKAGLAT